MFDIQIKILSYRTRVARLLMLKMLSKQKQYACSKLIVGRIKVFNSSVNLQNYSKAFLVKFCKVCECQALNS